MIRESEAMRARTLKFVRLAASPSVDPHEWAHTHAVPIQHYRGPARAEEDTQTTMTIEHTDTHTQ